MSLFDLTGKVVLATGGKSGIGLGFLQGCAKQGADVVVWDRNPDRTDETIACLRHLGAPSVHVETVDVSDEAQVDAAMARTLAATGRLDCAFANAGISHRAPSFTDLSSEDYHRLLAVNQHGAFYTLRAAARAMKARAEAGEPGGSLVACGSLSIFHGLKGMEHYAAAKGALFAMIKGLAVELGPYGIRANMLAPGFFPTSIGDGADHEQMAKVLAHFASITPLGRVGALEDIEGPAAYLASDASRYHTGDVLVIDGGRLVKNV